MSCSTNTKLRSEILNDIKATKKDLIAESSLKQYISFFVTWVMWLLEEAPGLIREDLFPEDTEDKKSLKEFQKKIRDLAREGDVSDCPIYTEKVTVQHLQGFLVSKRKKKTGEILGADSYKSYRSGIAFILKQFDFKVPGDWEEQLGNAVKSMIKRGARDKGQKGKKVKVGKDKLPFDLYLKFGKNLIKTNVFAHAFTTISWNLMCRASNTMNINIKHIEWEGDALQIYFAHSKTDQTGIDGMYPRHIYANPIHPHICPIISLGVFLLCNPRSTSSTDLRLFQGDDQYQRYSKGMQTMWNSGTDLSNSSQQVADYGTHSTRKGASSYAASGSVAAPSHSAVCLRAGWSQGKTLDKYLKFQAEGDRYVGRTVAGLPINSEAFAILPPHWKADADQDLIEETIATSFSNLPANMDKALRFILASVVYHREWLRSTLPRDHQLFQSPLFSKKGLVDTLGRTTKAGYALPEDGFQPTGVPPHVIQLRQMQQLLNQQKEIMQDLKQGLVPRIAEAFRNVLEENGVETGTINHASMKNMMKEVMKDSGLLEVMQHRGGVQQAPQEDDAGRPSTSMKLWGGKLHVVGENFKLPQITLKAAYQQWHLGNSELGVPPLKRIPSSSLSNKEKKRYSDMKGVMQKMDSLLSQPLPKKPDHQRVNQAFDKVFPKLGISATSSKGRKRRLDQILWTTICKDLKQKKKVRRKKTKKNLERRASSTMKRNRK